MMKTRIVWRRSDRTREHSIVIENIQISMKVILFDFRVSTQFAIIKYIRYSRRVFKIQDFNFYLESDFSQPKTNTRNDIRVLNKLCDKHTNNTHLSNRCGETKSRTHVHSRSLDATSKRQHIQSGITKFNASLLSPQDILNNIIDQCSRVDDDCNNTVENDISNNESMFELGQHLIERYNPDLLHNI